MPGALKEDPGEKGALICLVVGATAGFRQRCGQLGAALGKSWERRTGHPEREVKLLTVNLVFVLHFVSIYLISVPSYKHATFCTQKKQNWI